MTTTKGQTDMSEHTETVTPLGYVAVLSTGQALPDPETDDRAPAVFATVAEALAAADAAAAELADHFGITLGQPTAMRAADYTPPAPAPVHVPGAGAVAALAGTYPAPEARITYEYAVLLPSGLLYRDETAQARGWAYTAYPTAERADAAAADIADQLSDRGIPSPQVRVIRRATVTTVGTWE
ncbi:hypothetical protein [Nocardia sp. CC201C]|uniref:hypothetical protein n=1 Tax=Nocardia sp. CC201C TaxID=3044575 RepID=UPI0024A834B2|nr:hypothetical protein [Nocardia sp. CC201C]